MKNLKIMNPKRNATSRRGWQGFFPYYAGFSEQFAREIIGSAALPTGAVVWDPWNGSGTTTSAAASLGISGRGTDINPVMVIVAKARLLPVTEVDSLLSLTREVVASAGRSRAKLKLDDPLLSWFDPNTSTYLRNLERSIRTLLVGERTLGKAGTDLTELSTIASAIYVALFTTAREAVNHAKTSNPTWLRKPGGQLSVAVLNRQSFASAFQSNVKTMITSMDGGLAPLALTEPRPTVTIEPGDTASMDASNLQADFVLTSPPYCTRIDYAAATRVELAFVEPWQAINAHQLSRMMIGSTRVPLDVPAPLRDWGSTCIAFLKKVRDHESKASRSYYLKNHLDYFAKMALSMKKVSDGMRDGATAVFVVQDSYYKDVWNPLPDIISEMAALSGLREHRRESYSSRRSMSGINTASLIYRTHKAPIEAVMCFRKD